MILDLLAVDILDLILLHQRRKNIVTRVKNFDIFSMFRSKFKGGGTFQDLIYQLEWKETFSYFWFFKNLNRNDVETIFLILLSHPRLL